MKNTIYCNELKVVNVEVKVHGKNEFDVYVTHIYLKFESMNYATPSALLHNAFYLLFFDFQSFMCQQKIGYYDIKKLEKDINNYFRSSHDLNNGDFIPYKINEESFDSNVSSRLSDLKREAVEIFKNVIRKEGREEAKKEVKND